MPKVVSASGRYVTTTPRVTSYLVEHAPQMQPDVFTEQLIAAALQARDTRPEASPPGRGVVEPLTPAELRIPRLLPTSTYLQIADTCTSRATQSKSSCGRSTKSSG